MDLDAQHGCVVRRERRRIPGVLSVTNFFARAGAVCRLPEDRSSACSERYSSTVVRPPWKDLVERLGREADQGAGRDVVDPDVVVDREDSGREGSPIGRYGKLAVIGPGTDWLNVSLTIDHRKQATAIDASVWFV